MQTLNLAAITTVIVSAFTAITLQFQTGIIKILSYSECDKPIYYKLGILDPKFGLSKETILTDMQNATDIWSKTYSKNLFINSSSAALTVNFVYDQRSALITQIDELQDQLNQKGPTLQQKVNAYESDLTAFKEKLTNFNVQVNQINKSGGASPDEFKKLTAQRNELAVEGNSLNARASQLNMATHDFNSEVQDLNQNVDEFNQKLEQQPEEGLYDPNNNTITIYFADNDKDLIHTLAHEFGHALGMQHTDNPQSIMYIYTTSFTVVTPEDKQQLDYVCREQLLPVLWIQEFNTWIQKTAASLATR